MSLATVTLSLVRLLIEKVVVAPAVIAIVTGTAWVPATAQPPQPPQLVASIYSAKPTNSTVPPPEAGPLWSFVRLDSNFFYVSARLFCCDRS